MSTRRIRLALVALVTGLTLLPAAPVNAGHGTNLPYGGVNTHLTYSNTKYYDYEYVAQKLKESETKFYRDAINPGQGQAYYDRFATAVRRIREVSGARLVAIFVRADQTPAQIQQVMDQLAPLVAEGHVAAFEGSNEWDNVAGSTVSGWEQQVRTHQCELWNKSRAQFPTMPVIGPSLSYKTTGSFVGDLSHCMSIGNFHYYSADGIYSPDLVARWRDKGIVAGWADGSGDPMLVTESNGIYSCDGAYPNTSEQTQAQRMTELYQALGGLEYGGAHRVFTYELLNGSKPSRDACHRENNFGIFRSDGSRKPVFTPVLEANRRG